MCIPPPPPRASANVLGTVNAIASAIVVYFMAISFTCDIGDDRTLTTKFFFRRARGCSLEAHLAGFSFIPFQLPFSQCVSLRSALNARSTPPGSAFRIAAWMSGRVGHLTLRKI
jgi:hypothetical protein